MELPLLHPDNIVKGKWEKNSYKIIKQLGQGGIGTVYKVINQIDGESYALKLSKDNLSLNREYTLLKELEKINIIPKSFEIDDVSIDNKTYYFIVVEYIPGITLNEYRKNKKISNINILGIVIILLKFMTNLQEKGYILGDTKLDNIMVNREGRVIRIIDLGGVVKLNSTIKEFTPAYDRASWKCGDRLAESSYDLFSATMILTHLLLNMEINPYKDSVNNIKERIRRKSINCELKSDIIKILDGEKKDIKVFANTLLTLYNKNKFEKQITKGKSIDYKINIFFWSSVSLFITSILLVLFK